MSQDLYAVVKTGGKQYTVKVGQRVSIEMLTGSVGDTVSLGEVLLVRDGSGSVKVGDPFISGATVTAKIVGQKRDKKVYTFRKKIKTGYVKTIGHRQYKTQVLVENISA